MAEVRQGLKYSKDHDWVRAEGNVAYIGITDYAQSSLGDIVFADGEPADSVLSAGGEAGVVESVKAASDVCTPVSGTVLEVNPVILDDPAQINAAPYETWMVKLTLADKGELDALMDASDYEAYCGSL